MNEGTSVLLGLEDEFTVLQLERIDADTVRVVIEVIDPEGACPECGVLTSRIKERPLVRVKDLSASGQRTDLWWLKRRLVCREPACGTATFTQQSRAVPARSRLTTRLREKIGSAIASGNRAVSEVASEYQVAWSTAHRALIALANQWLPEPEPTRVLGIDETRARSVRWVLEEAGWTRSNPWMTSFVNADPTLPGHLLGLTPGRSGACVIDWLALQTPAFRAGIDLGRDRLRSARPAGRCGSRIDRYNSARPHTRLGNAPPAEYEAAHCAEPTKSSRPAMTPA